MLYGVDATKLHKAGKEIRKGGFDRIVFNFPHVGGLTKDVNRQVRYNQGIHIHTLLSSLGCGFMLTNACGLELLVGFFKSAMPLLLPGGAVIITVFEGEPYELWNIRDLARHVGLKVGRSFRFQASAYPGYKHARTLGNIGSGGGWKGEDRPARTYIFEVKDGDDVRPQKNKRKREESDDEDD